MRRSVALAILATAAIGLSACSEQTQQAAQQTASLAADDAATNVSVAASQGAEAIATGATKAAEAIDRGADQIKARVDDRAPAPASTPSPSATPEQH